MSSDPSSCNHLWSACPTPLTPKFEIDEDSLHRSVEWQHSLGIEGLFVAGTSGEGACLTDSAIDLLTRKTVEYSAGRMPVSVQVTDNSIDRVLDRIRRAQQSGVSLVTLAPPLFEVGVTDNSLLHFYGEILDRSPLPVCIYQLPRKTLLPTAFIEETCAHPNLRMIKDSTGDAARQKLVFAAAGKRSDLVVLTGIEIGYYDDYVRGFHGGLLGTAILNAKWARAMHTAISVEDHRLAKAISNHMGEFLYAIFGGKSIRSWMGGLKLCLHRMGIFTSTTSYYDMPPTKEVQESIEDLVARKFWEYDPTLVGSETKAS
jgi:4-hydroxy-tetrahydrodipicolinate synthase